MDPVSYEQIVRELAVKRGLKPWELALSAETVAPTPATAPTTTADDAMALAQKRAGINRVVGQLGQIANPETALAQQGQAPKSGLLNLLMSLMR